MREPSAPDFASLNPGYDLSHHVKQPISFPRRVFAPGVLTFASLTRIEGWAERRETFGCSAEHPWGVSCASKTRVNALLTRYARRLRGALRPIARQDARERAYDAGRSPLGAPPWRFWAPGAALPSPSAPAVLQRQAGAFRGRAASSSHPGRSAWRAGSRASRGERLRAAAAGRHASLRLQDRLRRRPSMSQADEPSSTDTIRSQ
jgi:hypothetical protein